MTMQDCKQQEITKEKNLSSVGSFYPTSHIFLTLNQQTNCFLGFFFTIVHAIQGPRTTQGRWFLNEIVVGHKGRRKSAYYENMQDRYWLTLDLKTLRLQWLGVCLTRWQFWRRSRVELSPFQKNTKGIRMMWCEDYVRGIVGSSCKGLNWWN